jgi:hypothetical protein
VTYTYDVQTASDPPQRSWNNVFQASQVVPTVLAIAGVLAAVGGTIATRQPHGDAHPWFAWSLALCFLTALGLALYVIVVPAITWLESERTRWVAFARERLLKQRERLACATDALARTVNSEPRCVGHRR